MLHDRFNVTNNPAAHGFPPLHAGVTPRAKFDLPLVANGLYVRHNGKVQVEQVECDVSTYPLLLSLRREQAWREQS